MSTANAPRTRLGRYQLVRHLVSGGMADLWLARSPAEQHVALRRVHAEQARDHRFVQTFLDEVRVAQMLRHPNIAAVLDVGEERGEYFVATEWVHGVDLRRILGDAHAKRRQVPLEHVAGIALATTAALEHAQTRGVVHGDVSPASILVGFDGHVKVTGFGLAKAASRTRETQPGVLGGKVSYLSPEHCVGGRIDARSDIYALGIVLYELVVARRLFKATNDFLGMTAILHGEVPLPSTVRPGIPPELDAIIMTALARDPERRFQSVEVLRAALEQLCAAKHLRASPALLADHVRKAFGTQAAPWFPAPTPLDFDGDAAAIVEIPVAALHQPTSTPVNGDEATDIVAPLPLLEVGDATMMMRSAPKAGRERRHVAAIAIIVFGLVAAGALVLYAELQPAPRGVEAPPPAPSPSPAPVAAPALEVDAAGSEPEPAPEPVVVAEPPPRPVKQEIQKKKKKKKRGKRPIRRANKPVQPEAAWDRDALFPK